MARRSFGTPASRASDVITKDEGPTGVYSQNVGDGVSTSIPVTHNFGTLNVNVDVYDAVTGELVEPDVYRTDINTVTLGFDSPPVTNEFVAVVMGGAVGTVVASTDITDSTAAGRTVLTAATAALARAALGINVAHAYVATAESSSATAYGDLATTTDQVTVTIGASGIAVVMLHARFGVSAANVQAYISFACSGANTMAAGDAYEVFVRGTATTSIAGAPGAAFVLTGLTPGTTSFKMKYKAGGGTGTWEHRRIAVLTL